MANTKSGTVAQSGEVRCECGKNVGKVTGEGVEFWCRSCKAPVTVRFNEMKLTGMLSIAASIQTCMAGFSSCVASLQKVAEMVSIMEATPSPA